jgi:hypothetical protein
MLAEIAVGVAGNVAQIYLALVAKTGARFAGCSVERDKPCVERGFEDGAAAGLFTGVGWTNPGGYAAIDKTIAVVEGAVDFGIVGPALLAGDRIERDDAVEGRGEIERSIDKNRSGFKAAASLAVAAVGNVPSMKTQATLSFATVSRLICVSAE